MPKSSGSRSGNVGRLDVPVAVNESRRRASGCRRRGSRRPRPRRSGTSARPRRARGGSWGSAGTRCSSRRRSSSSRRPRRRSGGRRAARRAGSASKSVIVSLLSRRAADGTAARRQAHEHEAVVLPHRDRVERVVAALELLVLVDVRRREELPVEVVRPGVVRALEDLAEVPARRLVVEQLACRGGRTRCRRRAARPADCARRRPTRRRRRERGSPRARDLLRRPTHTQSPNQIRSRSSSQTRRDE